MDWVHLTQLPSSGNDEWFDYCMGFQPEKVRQISTTNSIYCLKYDIRKNNDENYIFILQLSHNLDVIVLTIVLGTRYNEGSKIYQLFGCQ